MKDKNAFSRRALVKSSLLGLVALPINNILYAKSKIVPGDSTKLEFNFIGNNQNNT